MRLILNDGSSIPLSTKSKRKLLIKAALVYKPHWGSRKKKVVACSPDFTIHSMACLVAVFGTCKYPVWTSKRNFPLSETTVMMGHCPVVYQNWHCLT